MLKALADPSGSGCSIITSVGDEVCVCDLTPQFDVSGPTISHHLKVLLEAGLVDCERHGTWVYCWPVPERLRWISTFSRSRRPRPPPDPSRPDAP
ncbi:ArsR/SmtB family transcription factor [Kribbella qitaiheensis]|uniref:ArsR/SmtB family transcription factor n=1 Tax=Kribbella qitaiheensis TaxID=1544730 RepID=UPI001FE8115B|nr:metalloregulator ArsR/SmtB family transcription factor [Kribbella qitaiheensis]